MSRARSRSNSEMTSSRISNYVPKPHEHTSLVVRQAANGRLAWVRAMQATVDHFGWGEQFDTEIEHRANNATGGWIQGNYKTRRFSSAGHQMTIWLGRDRHRPGSGNRRNFRVAHGFTKEDTAELAHFTQGDWYWMTTPSGEVWSREQWLDLYSRLR